jgi:hypothetical protein
VGDALELVVLGAVVALLVRVRFPSRFPALQLAVAIAVTVAVGRRRPRGRGCDAPDRAR